MRSLNALRISPPNVWVFCASPSFASGSRTHTAVNGSATQRNHVLLIHDKFVYNELQEIQCSAGRKFVTAKSTSLI